MKTWTEEQVARLKILWEQSPKEEIRLVFPNKSWNSICHKASRLGIKRFESIASKDIDSTVKENFKNGNGLKKDVKISTLEADNKRLKDRYDQALDEIKELTASLNIVKTDSIETNEIVIPSKSKEGEAVAFMIASDWHIDEIVRPDSVSGMNRFDNKIADIRVKRYFQNGLSLFNLTSSNIKIETIVLALLGDFISNDIHEDSAENNSMFPIDAIRTAQTMIASGIEFLLKNTKAKLIIPCNSGNHARTTKKIHIASEHGHSLEYYMYHNLANHFRNEPRVKFMIAEGYHSYINVFGSVIRFHHGHQIRYQGGVGGLYIPANKAIAQWNKMRRADLDVMGHWHQFKDAGIFVTNGSLIGYNAFALSIKADYEVPKQAYFLWDKKRGKTIVAPIFAEIV